MSETTRLMGFFAALHRRPDAAAVVSGSGEHAGVRGIAQFYQTNCGVLVSAEVSGLPAAPGSGFLGFHIHSGKRCDGDKSDPFAAAMGHYNPDGSPHPDHAGDLPPLLVNHGYAFQMFLTDRFTVREIIDRTVIIHSAPDDFTSQPAGNAGEKIACGEIRKYCC